MGLIEIQISTIADNAGLEETNAGLDELQSQEGEAGESTEDLGGGLGDLNGILGAVGATISAGAFLNLAAQLDAAGAAANRAQDTFDNFTGGRADEYSDRVTESVHGLIDGEDALAVSQDLLNQGMARNSTEAAEIIRNATVLGAAFSNIGAKQAAEDFTRLLETLSPRQMREFGITIDEVASKTRELQAANANLSDRAAQQQAIMELASQKAQTFSGVLDDQKAHIDALAIAWEDLGEAVGQGLADSFDPATLAILDMVTGLTSAISKTGDFRQRAIETSSTLQEYKQAFGDISEAELGYRQGNVDTQADFDRMRQKYIDANFAARDYIQTQIFGAGAASDQTAALRDEAAATEAVRLAQEQHAAVMAQQEALQLGILSQIDQLTAGTSGLAGVFDTANQLLGGYQLTQEQQLTMYEELGLATGQVTLQQVSQANELRRLTNEYVAGHIEAEAYAAALEHIKSGGDSAFLTLDTLSKSITEQGIAMGKSGDDLDKFVTSHLNEATKAAGDTEAEMKAIQAEAAKVGQIDVKPKVRTEDIVAATEVTEELLAALRLIPTDIYTTLHIVQEGSPTIQGGEPGSP
jgi:hypothetical protein